MVTHFVEGDRMENCFGTLCFMFSKGLSRFFLGHPHAHTMSLNEGWCSGTEPWFHLLAGGHPLCGSTSELKQKKMCLHNWTDRQTRQKTKKKERKGSQCFPAKQTACRGFLIKIETNTQSRDKHITCRDFLTKIHCLGGYFQEP